MVVRAYFLLADQAGGDATLVPVLREVPKRPAVAHAAMTALLEGPTAAERRADPPISTVIPTGTKLLGVRVDDGVAVVDLSGRFESGGGTRSMTGRLAQVVYTLTQFSRIDAVRIELDGRLVTTLSGEGVDVSRPLDRADFRDEWLPPIWVDRPAWGAGLATPARVTGRANVFEAQFVAAILDGAGDTLVERPVTATCGSGCWGRFDVTLRYAVATPQWGTLRVWDPSERDGSPEAVREYPVWLTPAG
jgi:hypothetical protein